MASGRYVSEGRKMVNRRRKYAKKLARAIRSKERAEMLGRKTKVDKVIAEIQAAMKKNCGE